MYLHLLLSLPFHKVAEMASRLLNTAQAADYLGLSISFLNKARLTGSGPTYRKIGRNVRYEPTELDGWLTSKRRRSTCDAGAPGERH